MTIYRQLGVRTIINAKGTATRLSGGIMRAEITQAMMEASQSCVDMAELEAAASKIIAGITGAEAGYIASGAAACLLLATAACVTGLDPSRMARLPDTTGMKNQVIMVRSQRNFYDHAVRAAGVTIVEVGLPDRYAGAGVRDAETWEIEDAITDQTAAIFYVADSNAQPPFRDVAKIARRTRIPLIVDAAAQLPPQANLRQFIKDGADLVAFSGGKAIGGPQASGFLCGKRDLIMAAALQHLDLDIHWDMWEPPTSLIRKKELKGLPAHGIGRTCKVGKEEIVGLLTALQLFVKEGDKTRHAHWLATLQEIRKKLGKTKARISVDNEDNIAAIPVIRIALAETQDATSILMKLQRQAPAIHLDPSLRSGNILIVNPVCLAPADVQPLARALNSLIV
jgi:L-seryl-tRNA(Ser) seleniumtransferase